jgi:YD repeat-containing protein
MDLRRFAVPPDKAEAPEIEAQAAFYAWRRETKLPAFPTGQICRSDANSVFGRVECAQPDYPDGTSLSAIYNPDGSVQQVSGSRVYPAAYMYDYQGRRTNMTTWTNFAAGTGAAKTSWNYDPYRGWLTSKLDNNTYGPTYAYTAAGRLGSRTWARGIITSNSYNAVGNVATVNYSDGTPGITNIFDRLGRLNSNICNGITTTLFYDSANDPLGGIVFGRGVGRIGRHQWL